MKAADFDYDLPARCIAQRPAEPRDSSKLMCLHRRSGEVAHHHFSDIVDMINANDVLVMNDTRVLPARLDARKAKTGGRVEILLLKQMDALRWQALVGGKNVTPGMRLRFDHSDISCQVVKILEKAERILEFSQPVNALLRELGEIPLPPYIKADLDNDERYQTIYSKAEGSAAAPTAGLHFTPEILASLKRKGVKLVYCTLHIGLDTFQPVTASLVADHKIHSEFATLDSHNAQIINEARLTGGRIIAVGTTSTRTLETAAILSAGGDPSHPAQNEAACPWKTVIAFEGDTRLFIYPGYRWRVVDAMITNFHLPRSTLLMMLSAFVGRDRLLAAYEIAKQENYRFYSFGDAMFIS